MHGTVAGTFRVIGLRVVVETLTVVVVALLLAACCFASAAAQTLALTFDDGFDPREEPQSAFLNAAILDALAYAEVRSMLFVAGRRVDSADGLALVRAWGDAGHGIANHTYSHPSLGSTRVTLDDFVADCERNEALLRDLPGWTRRLRFPYLKEGDTAVKRDGLRAWMARHDYRSGAVSIDASDWYYDARFRAWRAAHPDGDPAPFRRAYLAHLMDRAAYYDGLSRRVVGRSVAHVLLLHANAINAAFLPDVIAMFRAGGWTIVPPEDAYRDPVYQALPDGLPAGESLVWSLAREAGVPRLRYPGEDDVYEKPILDALGL